MNYLILLTLLLPSLSHAAWQYSNKKTPEQSMQITTETGEVVNAYLWLPQNYSPNNQYKAVVMVHGCGGAHYKDSPNQWTARYIAGKFKVWGKLLNNRNILVFMVDSFSTRDSGGDVGGGVCNSTDPLARPAKIDPVSVIPVDIASAIRYLKSRPDVLPDKVGVIGFSNGGTSVLVLANHQHLEARSSELIDAGKTWFNLPFIEDYTANLIVSMYPGCGLNGYTRETKYTFTEFDTYTETYLFAASNDTTLPANTLDKCSTLRELDASVASTYPDMLMTVVENTDHQFDYKENNEIPVYQTIQSILSLFESM